VKHAPLVVDSGKVVQLAPAVLSRAQAAAYLGCSVGLLDAMRAADVKRGEQIEGPAWVRLAYGIRYRVADLDAYLARTSVPLGVMESKRRIAGQDVEAAQ
jgi:hypothetical protein